MDLQAQQGKERVGCADMQTLEEAAWCRELSSGSVMTTARVEVAGGRRLTESGYKHMQLIQNCIEQQNHPQYE